MDLITANVIPVEEIMQLHEFLFIPLLKGGEIIWHLINLILNPLLAFIL